MPKQTSRRKVRNALAFRNLVSAQAQGLTHLERRRARARAVGPTFGQLRRYSMAVLSGYFDDNQGYVIGHSVVPPRSHSVEDCVFHFRKCSRVGLANQLSESLNAEHVSGTVEHLDESIGVEQFECTRLINVPLDAWSFGRVTSVLTAL